MSAREDRSMNIGIFNTTGAALLMLSLNCALAQTPAGAQPGPLASSRQFAYQDGKQLYQASCQGCHMADGKGAKGAGAYPALTGNPQLAAAAYPAIVILYGKGGMPSLKRYMDDAQIAAVVNYVRTNFGNRFTDSLSVDDVKKMSQR